MTTHRRVRRTLWLALGTVFVVQMIVLAAWWVPVGGMGRIAIVAHHGDVAHWPEGTLEAIRAAAASQADGIEIDVQTSADGTWWVFHDRKLDRLTTSEGLFSNLTDAEVAELQVAGGMGFSQAPDRIYRVPRLSAVMDALADYSGILVLDIKVTATEEYETVARLFVGREVTFICQTDAGARAVKSVDPAFHTAASPGVQPRTSIDYRLLDARTRIRSPLDLWFGDPALVYEDGSDYGKENPEWLRRADAWGARMYLTNRIEAAIAELD